VSCGCMWYVTVVKSRYSCRQSSAEHMIRYNCGKDDEGELVLQLRFL